MNPKTVCEIVGDYCRKNGFDGLAGDECSCNLNDLTPCESGDAFLCVPGYKVPCTCEKGCDWHISTVKPDGAKINDPRSKNLEVIKNWPHKPLKCDCGTELKDKHFTILRSGDSPVFLAVWCACDAYFLVDAEGTSFTVGEK